MTQLIWMICIVGTSQCATGTMLMDGKMCARAGYVVAQHEAVKRGPTWAVKRYTCKRRRAEAFLWGNQKPSK